MKNNNKCAKIDLYTLLNVKKDATKEEIKKAYKVLALKTHPDKNQNDEKASENFANLNKAYTVLMDDEKRKIYDNSGFTDEDDEFDIENTYDFYKNIYPTITTQDIEDFTTKYRGSEMEIEDLVNFYEENEGDLIDILEWIPLSKNEDIDRFICIFEDLIKKKVIKKNKNYLTTKNKIRLLSEDDQEEVEEEKKKFEDLCQQITKKRKNNDNYFEKLKNKFCEKEEVYDDINDEEFEEIQKKLKKKKVSKKK